MRKLLLVAGLLASVAGLSYLEDRNIKKMKANPFLIKEITAERFHSFYTTSILGDFQEFVEEDVAGNRIPENFVLYDCGHAFYLSGEEKGSNTFSGPRVYRRITPNTPQADYLYQLRPNFKLAEPKVQ